MRPLLSLAVRLTRLIRNEEAGPAIYDLAEQDRSRRQRFVAAASSGVVDVLLSVTNVAQLARPQGNSFDAVKEFLNTLGPHWFPLALNVFSVLANRIAYFRCSSIGVLQRKRREHDNTMLWITLPGRRRKSGERDGCVITTATRTWRFLSRSRKFWASLSFENPQTEGFQ